MSTNSEPSELVNGSSEPEPSAAAAAAPPAADPDPQLPDPEVQPLEAEKSGEAQPVNAEVSNSVTEEEISNELSGEESRTAESGQDAESDPKLGNAEGSRTFTMRELLNELKNGDANGNDGRETDTPRRLVSKETCLFLDLIICATSYSGDQVSGDILDFRSFCVTISYQ